MAIIEVKNLKKNYEYYKKNPGLLASFKALFKRKKVIVEAVRDIDFKIEEGEFVGFLGPNGAGKTTTLKMLSGIIHPTSGEASVIGYNPTEREKDFQKQFSFIMGHKNQLWWDLPAMESFLLNKEIYEIPPGEFHKNLNELSELLEIEDVLNIPVRKLSLGQRMKCELAAALLHKPKILFLDEPTLGLDVTAQKNIRDFLKKYNQKNNTTIILTSHYMEDIKELCERVIIIDLGKIVYDGKLSELINKYAPYKIINIVFNGPGVKKEELVGYGEIVNFSSFSVSLKVTREEVKNTASKILFSSLPVDDIMIDEVSVDDVIREIFKK